MVRAEIHNSHSEQELPTRANGVTRLQVVGEIAGWLIGGGAAIVGLFTAVIRSTSLQESSGLLMALAGVSELVLIISCVLTAFGGALLAYGTRVPATTHTSSSQPTRARVVRGVAAVLVVVLCVLAVSVNVGSFTSSTADIATLQAAGPGTDVTIISYNLLYRNPDPDHSARQLLTQSADVLVLTEYTAVHQRALRTAGIEQQYPHFWEEVAGGGDGIAIWSKYPLQLTAVHQLSRKTPQVSIDVDGHSLNLIGVHLAAPTQRNWMQYWQRDIDDLYELVSNSADVVVAGDFNSTMGHQRFRRLLNDHQLNNAHDVAGGGVGGTWPTNFMVAPIMRIDHILFGPEVELLDYDRLGSWGSDHQAIAATLWLSPPNL